MHLHIFFFALFSSNPNSTYQTRWRSSLNPFQYMLGTNVFIHIKYMVLGNWNAKHIYVYVYYYVPYQIIMFIGHDESPRNYKFKLIVSIGFEFYRIIPKMVVFFPTQFCQHYKTKIKKSFENIFFSLIISLSSFCFFPFIQCNMK